MTKSITRLLSQVLAATLMISLLSPTLQAAKAPKAEHDPHPILVIFAGEMRAFTKLARKINADALENDPKDSDLEELQQTGARIARLYLADIADNNKANIEQFLKSTLKENKDIHKYFTFIGNALSEQAEKFLEAYRTKQTKIKRWSVIGGTVIGIAVGGGYIYFKLKSGVAAAGSVLTGKDWLIAASAVVGGGAAGFVAGTAYSYYMPVDRAVKNAKDFKARYPHGEDFIDELYDQPDLKRTIDEAQRALEAAHAR